MTAPAIAYRPDPSTYVGAVRYLDTDAAGEPREIVLLAGSGGSGAQRPVSAAVGALDTPALRRRIWWAAPRCARCGGRLPSPEAGQLVVEPEGPRLACRAACLDAPEPEEGVRDLRLVPDLGEA